MELKGMKEQFFEWLNECPVEWSLINQDEDSLTYCFNKQEDDED